jgi:hypothetical protein
MTTLVTLFPPPCHLVATTIVDIVPAAATLPAEQP